MDWAGRMETCLLEGDAIEHRHPLMEIATVEVVTEASKVAMEEPKCQLGSRANPMRDSRVGIHFA